jgi:FkbM family methyltransferase
MNLPARYIRIALQNKRPVRFLAGRALVTSGLCRFLTIPQQGYRLRFYPSNLSEQLWSDRTWRDADLNFMRAYLRPGDHVIDVGANVGDTALTAALAVGAAGRVWAVEPHPRTFSFLKGNIALNDKSAIVTAVNAAAAEADGTLSFSDDRRDDMNRVGQPGVAVAARRLDDMIAYRGPVDLMKIDVEGYELPALKGAPTLLGKTQCAYVEVSEAHFRRFGYGVRDVLSLLEASGFALLRPDGERRLRRIGSDHEIAGVQNIVAARDMKRLAARSGWSFA